MEKFSLGPDAFERVGDLVFATKLFQTYKDTLNTLSITFREPGQLGSESTRSLLRSVKAISRLKKIGVGNVDLTGAEMGMAFRDVVLKWSHTLEEVRISCCLVDHDFVEDAGVALGSLVNLKVLVFHCNLWSDTFFGTLLQHISPPISLTDLCLSSSDLTAASFGLLSNTFHQHRQITCLNLSGNNNLFKCDRKMSQIFFDGLVVLQELQSLYIHQCGMDRMGSIALFQTVEKMPNLDCLMLYDNNFALRDGWARSLPKISGLSTLWVGRQVFPLSVTEVDAIIDALRRNVSLTYLDVSGYPPRLHNVIRTVLARNKCIKRAQVLISKKDLPIALLPRMFSALKPRDGEPSAQHLVVRTAVERWVGFSTLDKAESEVWQELAP